MITHSEYTAYFEEIARRHKAIGHKPGDPAGKRFARIILNVDEFGQDNLSEFIKGLRILKTPLLLAVAYDHTYQDNLSDNYKKQVDGAFILLDTYSDDYAIQDAKYDALEAVGEQILGFMDRDFKARLAKYKLDFNQAGGEKIGKVGQYLGMRFAFSYTVNANSRLLFNPENWID